MRLQRIISSIIAGASLTGCSLTPNNPENGSDVPIASLSSSDVAPTECLIREQNLLDALIVAEQRCYEEKSGNTHDDASAADTGYVIKRLSPAPMFGRIIRSNNDEIVDKKIVDSRSDISDGKIDVAIFKDTTTIIPDNKLSVKAHADNAILAPKDENMVASEKMISHMFDLEFNHPSLISSSRFSNFTKIKVPFISDSLSLDEEIEIALGGVVTEIVESKKVVLRGYVKGQALPEVNDGNSIKRAVSVKKFLMAETRLPASHFRILYRKPGSTGQFVNMDIHHEG